jgi:fatty-acyl-CoA synthase
LSPALRYWVSGRSTLDFAPLDSALERISEEPLNSSERAAPSIDSTALYVYTSGTTGKPKAAKISHYRVMQWSQWFAGMMDIRPDDRMYNCLPLYHSVGGVIACGATLAGGGAVVIRARFSASDFWRDVHAERCTLFQYIGELCRYLVAAPQQAIETDHVLRLACGNGLRRDVWQPFKSRFRIPQILEYYASTEGNFSLYNCEQEPGAIGRIPPFLNHRLPVALLRVDIDREEPLRNAAGFCESCDIDEDGEAAGLVPSAETARAGRFEGYADAKASADKLLRDVFAPGDVWYRTGDLMRRDARGFYFFVDRIGDTYRWKGENVAAAEVLSALAANPSVLDGVVYGVSVPGADGRAGMAALVTRADFDLKAFHAHVAASLPDFARPKFLRLISRFESTTTFKPKKQELMRAGFDPARIPDPLYFDDPRSNAYMPLDAARYADIAVGLIRV